MVKEPGRVASIVIEVVGSAVICGMAYATDQIIELHRRRALRT